MGGVRKPYVLSDALWEQIEPLIPKRENTHPFGGGRPRRPDRQCMEAILFVLSTGCQWKALDATGLCPGSTAHDRFQEWVKAGVFRRIWEAGLAHYDELKGIDWEWLCADGSQGKAPLGGEKSGPNPTDRGKRGVKRSVLCDGAGVVLGVVIEGANRPDLELLPKTLECVPDSCQQRLVRWEKKAANYEAMLYLAAGIIAFQQAGLFG